MSRIGIDTNILARYMVNDIPEQYKIAESLLEKYCTQENPGFISLIVCCELDWVLRKSYKYSREQVHGMFVTLLSANDLEVENYGLFIHLLTLEDYSNMVGRLRLSIMVCFGRLQGYGSRSCGFIHRRKSRKKRMQNNLYFRQKSR